MTHKKNVKTTESVQNKQKPTKQIAVKINSFCLLILTLTDKGKYDAIWVFKIKIKNTIIATIKQCIMIVLLLHMSSDIC